MTQSPFECRTIADFGDGRAIDRWQVINDGVMGGLSRGGIRQDDEAMRFAGEINTNGGGFSSIRMPARGLLDGASMIRVTMRSDGRDYQLSLRSDARRWGRSVAYRGMLRPEPTGDGWAVASVALDALEPSIFGQRVQAPDYDAATTQSLGFILADGQDGPFSMRVRKIEAC